MRRVNAAAFAAIVAVSGFALPAEAQVVAFEGARLILGDGRTVENGTLVIDGSRIVQAGAGVTVPAGAARVNAAGKTIMPAIIDTHVHLNPIRDRLIRDLKLRGYYGISAALSMGLDNLQLLSVRQENIPGAARFFSAGRGVTMPEPGRITVPHWITTPEEGRKAVQDAVANKVDIVKIWVDTRDNQFRKLTPDLYGPIIEEAHKNNLRVTAHIFDMEDAKGLMRANVDSFAHGVRDKDIDDETLAMIKARPNIVLILADDLGWADLGCYGADLHETPRLDQFARESVKFTHAYAMSVCSPSRAMLLTGQHAARLGMTIWREGSLQKPKNRPLLEADSVPDLPRTRKTLAVHLKAAGYLTASVGKPVEEHVAGSRGDVLIEG